MASFVSSLLNPHPGSWSVAGVKLPDFGITEAYSKLIGAPANGQGGSQIRNVIPTYVSNSQNNANTTPNNFVPTTSQYPLKTSGDVLALTTGLPTTGGQGAGNGAGGSINLTAPSGYTGPSEGDVTAQQKAIYDQAANDIQAQNPLLDQSYNTAKGDIQTSMDEANKTAATQKDQLNTDFGDILKKQLQTYQDLNRQRQGTFSSLGSLDSSAFGEQQFRADQSFADQSGRTSLEKQKSLQSVDDQVTSYKKQADSQLAQLGIQYQQGKNAIASALANNDLASAQAISQAIDKVKTRAQEVYNSIANFANQAALLKTQGQNVTAGIGGISASPYGQEVAKMLQNLSASGNSMYSIPTSNVQGQGYISPNKKNPFLDFLSGLQG